MVASYYRNGLPANFGEPSDEMLVIRLPALKCVPVLGRRPLCNYSMLSFLGKNDSLEHTSLPFLTLIQDRGLPDYTDFPAWHNSRPPECPSMVLPAYCPRSHPSRSSAQAR